MAYAVDPTSCSADPVDVFLGVIWGVILYDPVHLGDVQASGRHVGTQQDARVSVTELKEGGGTLRLLLLPLRDKRKIV